MNSHHNQHLLPVELGMAINNTPVEAEHPDKKLWPSIAKLWANIRARLKKASTQDNQKPIITDEQESPVVKEAAPVQAIQAVKQVQPEEEKSPIILLPEDPIIVERLRKKLKVYRERSKRYRYYPPEDIDVQDVSCKTAVLERLLNDGKVDTWELSKELAAEYVHFMPSVYGNACGVIDSYANQRMNRVKGGSGF